VDLLFGGDDEMIKGERGHWYALGEQGGVVNSLVLKKGRMGKIKNRRGAMEEFCRRVAGG
jgi:hypothetical protein